MRILLVDDDVTMTTKLKLSFQSESDLQLIACNSCTDALGFLKGGSPVDVVICETHMADMDPADFMRRIRENHSSCLRLAISAKRDDATGLRLMRDAQQFLAKPCSAAELRDTIDRAQQVRQLIEAPVVKELIGRIDQFPQSPSTATAITLLADNDNASLADVAEVIERDVALSAKVLQLTNSAFFSFATPTTNVIQAVTRLGMGVVHSLAFSTGMLEKVGGRKLPLDLDNLNESGAEASLLARQFTTDPAERDVAASAAMLAHLGVIVEAACSPDNWREMMGKELDQWRTPLQAERHYYGCTHAQISACLLAMWGVPMPVVEVVLRHHDKVPTPVGNITALQAVIAACSLMEKQQLPEGWEKAPAFKRFLPLINDYLAA